ncbi:hypothetical protein V8C35DRAFT_103065 [Trichoderma chlorosporum]
MLFLMELLRWPKLFFVSCLLPLAQAYTVFETNCSAPARVLNYVSSPNTRGTLDILWSSLFTIFACTWTLQHPNVPKQRNQNDDKEERQREPRCRGPSDIEQQTQAGSGEQRQGSRKIQRWKWSLEKFGESTLRMVLTIIAPELIVAAASDELMRARSHNRGLQKYSIDYEEKINWSLRHSYYANMGGFVIHGRAPSCHFPYHLNGSNILTLRKRGYILKIPDIKEEEIRDKSKTDDLAKLIALGQIAWSIFQIIVRAARRLPVSPLEVAVAAYAVCAVIIYALYLKKPQRVDVAHTIQLTMSPIPPEPPWEKKKKQITRSVGSTAGQQSETIRPVSGTILQGDENIQLVNDTILQENENIQLVNDTNLKKNENIQLVNEIAPPAVDLQKLQDIPDEVLQILKITGTRHFFREQMGKVMKTRPVPHGAPISIDTINFASWELLVPAIAAFCAALFGGIHTIAWNFAFPSKAELILWRYICVYMITAPICAWLFFCFDKMLLFLYDIGGPKRFEGKKISEARPWRKKYLEYLTRFEKFERHLLKVTLYLLSFFYLIARLFILVEIFRTLFFLPVESYVSTWTTNMPHVG